MRHFRKMLTAAAYRDLCRMIDDRDGGCVICGTTLAIEHHHVVDRGEGGDDEAANMVCLCHHHHWMVDKGAPDKAVRMYWRREFQDYLESAHCQKWAEQNREKLSRIESRTVKK